jgi:anti-sigma B factor antagonist
MNEFRCEISDQAGHVVMKLLGQITFAEMDQLEKHVARVTQRKPSRIIVDLSGLQIITSAGLGALLKLHRKAQELNCDLRLAAPQPAIEDVLRTSRLDHIFNISATMSDALN